MAHWLLQANPQRWRIDDFFRENPASALDAWSITRYLDRVASQERCKRLRTQAPM